MKLINEISRTSVRWNSKKDKIFSKKVSMRRHDSLVIQTASLVYKVATSGAS